MMTVQQFKKATSFGICPDRENPLIQALDRCLADHSTLGDRVLRTACLLDVMRLCDRYVAHRARRRSLGRKVPVVQRLRQQAAQELQQLRAVQPGGYGGLPAAAPPPAVFGARAGATAYGGLPSSAATYGGLHARPPAAATPAAAPPPQRATGTRLIQRDPVTGRMLRHLQGHAMDEALDGDRHLASFIPDLIRTQASLQQYRDEAAVAHRDPVDYMIEQVAVRQDLGHLQELFKGVSYLTEQGRQEWEVVVRGGLVYWKHRSNGTEPVHTGDMTVMEAGSTVHGTAIMAIGPDRRIFTANHVQARFHHSSFLAGGAVVFAGDWTIDRGRVTCVRPVSGHYMPTPADYAHALLVLKSKGLPLDSCMAGWFRTDTSLKGMQYHNALSLLERLAQGVPAASDAAKGPRTVHPAYKTELGLAQFPIPSPPQQLRA